MSSRWRHILVTAFDAMENDCFTVYIKCSDYYSPTIGHVNEYPNIPTMHYFGIPRHAQSMIAHKIFAQPYWKFQWIIALWGFCLNILWSHHYLSSERYCRIPVGLGRTCIFKIYNGTSPKMRFFSSLKWHFFSQPFLQAVVVCPKSIQMRQNLTL